MKVTLRIEVTPEQRQALVDEWLYGSGVLNIQTGDANMEASLTYVKES